MVSIPITKELIVNIIAVIVSIIAVIYWVKLYKQLYKGDIHEVSGWSWLFVGVLGILLLNISSIFFLFSRSIIFLGNPMNLIQMDLSTIQIMSVIGRTIIGLSMTIGAYLLYAPMKKGFKYKFVPVTPVVEMESKKKSVITHVVEKGRSYLVNEEKPVRSNEVFLDLVTHGVNGLYISRRNPKEIQRRYGLKKTPIIWLTREKTTEKSINPTDLPGLGYTIKEFIKKTEDGVVLLDGLEYLITQNDFKDVLKFVQSLDDSIAMSNSRLIIPLDPSTLDRQQLHLLRRDMHILRTDI